MPEQRKHKRPSLAANTIAQSAPLLTGYIASLVAAPIVLHAIGLRNFGIWALTGALAQYAALLDFGLGPSLARFVALYDAEDRQDLVGEVMSAGMTTSLLIGTILAVGSLLAAAPLAQQLGGLTAGHMRTLLLSATCIFVCSTLVNALTAHRIGVRQMIAPNILATLGAAINFAFSVGAVLISSSVAFYAAANAVASVLTLLITATYILGVRGRRAPYRRPRWHTTRTLLAFSMKNQMQTAASLVNNQTDKMIIALFISPAAAGAYEIANRVAVVARSLGVYTVSAMVPTLTAELRGEPRERWTDTYSKLTTITSALSVPTLVLTAALAPVILGAWLGYTPTNSAGVVAALCLGYVVSNTTGVGFAIAYAAGDPGIPARSAVAMAVANVILTAALAPLFGIWGVLGGTAAAYTGGALLQVVLVHQRLEMPLSRYWQATLPTFTLAAALALPVLLVSLLARHSDRGVLILCVFGCSFGYLLAYVLIAERRGQLPPSLSRWVRSTAQRRREVSGAAAR